MPQVSIFLWKGFFTHSNESDGGDAFVAETTTDIEKN
jgi:hypothetical protein